jgi:hypothetical protein
MVSSYINSGLDYVTYFDQWDFNKLNTRRGTCNGACILGYSSELNCTLCEVLDYSTAANDQWKASGT